MIQNNDGSPFSMLDALNVELKNPLAQPINEDQYEDLDNPVAHMTAPDLTDVNNDTPLFGGNAEPGTEPVITPVATAPIDNDAALDLPTEDETSQVSLYYDAFAESFGWDASEEKPKTIEELIDHVGKRIDNNQSNYASDEIREINEYVANGGNLEDYFNITSSMTDYDNLDLSKSATQKQVVSDFLATQGMNNEAITRRINRYEDAGMLDDEAKDAVEYMKDLKSKEKATLFQQQEQIKIKEEQESEKFYTEVNKTIDSISDIRGVQIPANDKKQLRDYLFKVDNQGKSQYEKDFSGNLVKNLLESAYFTMKGDALIQSANRTGETSAVTKLKQALRSTSTSGRSSHGMDNSTPPPIWASVSASLGSVNGIS